MPTITATAALHIGINGIGLLQESFRFSFLALEQAEVFVTLCHRVVVTMSALLALPKCIFAFLVASCAIVTSMACHVCALSFAGTERQFFAGRAFFSAWIFTRALSAFEATRVHNALHAFLVIVSAGIRTHIETILVLMGFAFCFAALVRLVVIITFGAFEGLEPRRHRRFFGAGLCLHFEFPLKQRHGCCLLACPICISVAAGLRSKCLQTERCKKRKRGRKFGRHLTEKSKQKKVLERGFHKLLNREP